MTLLWVRHGQSTWNVLDRLQGAELGPPLTDLGREQAAFTAEELATRGIVRLLASPAVRAQQTAEIIGERLGLEVVTEPLLLEKGLEETVPEVLARIQQIVAADHPDHTVAVSHGDTIALAVGLLSGSMPSAPTNGSIHAVDPVSRQVDQWLG